MSTLTTVPFPAAAALTENGAFCLARAPGRDGGGSHDDPACGGRPAGAEPGLVLEPAERPTAAR